MSDDLTEKERAMAQLFFAVYDHGHGSPEANAKRPAFFRAFGLIEAESSRNLDGETIVIESAGPAALQEEK